MHATKRLLLLTSYALCIVFTQTARADYFGLEVVERTDLPICQDPSEPEIPYKLDVCEIHVVFDNPDDRVISTALCDVSTTANNGFFQHSMNYRDTAPACALIALEPTAECDSFITLGVDCFDLIDGSTPDPDFDSTGFNTSGEVSGGWYNSAPPNGQGAPDANGRVMIARFSYRQNKNTSGNVCVFAKLAGSDDITEFLMQPFDCSVPGMQGGGGGGGGGGRPLGCDYPDPSGCGTAFSGSCFIDDPSRHSCDCLGCCEYICSIDPCCCDPENGWDMICQYLAFEHCDMTDCGDCNNNGIPDLCDIDCEGGQGQVNCDIPNCGLSKDCNGDWVPDECQEFNRGPIFLSGHDADNTDQCWDSAGACGDVYGQLLKIAVNDSAVVTGPPRKLLAIGVNGWPTSDAAQALQWFNNEINGGPGAEIDFVTNIGPPEAEPTIANVDFSDYSAIYIPSVDSFTDGGITTGDGLTISQLTALNLRQSDIDNFVNFQGGGLMALTEAGVSNGYGWLPVALQAQDQNHSAACPSNALNQILEAPISCADLAPSGATYRNKFSGPTGFFNMTVLARSGDAPTGEAVILGDLGTQLGLDCNADGEVEFCGCQMDADGDGIVGAFDLAYLLGWWGPYGPGDPGRCIDASEPMDVEVGPFDLAVLLGAWGPCP